jgi:hypothetical protein
MVFIDFFAPEPIKLKVSAIQLIIIVSDPPPSTMMSASSVAPRVAAAALKIASSMLKNDTHHRMHYDLRSCVQSSWIIMVGLLLPSTMFI